jgi:hypothetical protein
MIGRAFIVFLIASGLDIRSNDIRSQRLMAVEVLMVIEVK